MKIQVSTLLILTSCEAYFYIKFMYTLLLIFSVEKNRSGMHDSYSRSDNGVKLLSELKAAAKSTKCLFRQITNTYIVCLIIQTSADFELNQRIQQKVRANSKRYR